MREIVLKKSVTQAGWIKIILIATWAALLSACTTSQTIKFADLDSISSSAMKRALYEQFEEWESVRYRFGGLAKTGIDCSGFIYLTFRDKFGIELPRTSRQLAQLGYSVPLWRLKTGDLVFFKTGRRQRHVGIYLEQKKFLHVSTRKGVTISSLDNVYWSGRYWKSVRIIDS